MDEAKPRRVNAILVAAAILLLSSAARAEIVSLEILRREPFAGGKSFGPAGPYEKIVAVARFAIDPAHPSSRAIADIDRAPRNSQGKVEFESDVFILLPRDPARGNGAIFYEVNNRGLKLALRTFNGAPQANDPASEGDAGDGYLFRRGYAVVWSGWIGELVPGEGKLLLRAPVALENGKPLRGIVRFETSANAPAETLPLARREGLGSYRPTERGLREGILTFRMRETDPRVEIPRPQWSVEPQPLKAVEAGVPGTLGPMRLRVAGGFRPGYLYELVCEAEGSLVHGVCYAAVRDLVSFLKHDASPRNPLRGFARRAYGFGISQSGRFLRNFLHLDFNADEAGRKVFDALMPHVAGGGLGFFHQRFAQPSRYNAQHEEHLYPCDRFPFTYGEEKDPFTGQVDGILKRARHAPLIFHTQHAAEYWHRSGSLVHTDPKGERDAEIPPSVRVYAFGGIQHSPTHSPIKHTDHPPNPADPRPFLKALLDALDAWTRDGAAPPPSLYPRIDRGTLALPDAKSAGFPAIPGVRFPDVIQRPHALDTAVEPPRILGDYVVRVPRSDADGNDLGTLLLPEIAAPLGTYTGWNLRGREVGAEGMLAELMGSYIAFSRTRAEREARGDPRPSLEERYGTFEEYRKRFAAACERLVAERFLLREDAERLIAERAAVRGLFP